MDLWYTEMSFYIACVIFCRLLLTSGSMTTIAKEIFDLSSIRTRNIYIYITICIIIIVTMQLLYFSGRDR